MKMTKNELLWRFGLPAAVMLGGLLLGLGAGILMDRIELRDANRETARAEAPAQDPAQGVGRAPAVIRYRGGATAEEEEILPDRDVYVEGEGPAPAWYRPDEPMAIEWVDHLRDATKMVDDPVDDPVDENINSDTHLTHGVDYNTHPPVGIDRGGIDWNICTERVGWDGHMAEAWELDLYSRIMYLEFWGTSPECCEAGADSMLRLWESGYFGSTLGGVLSAVTETGAYCYSTYPAVWATEYDPDGLAEMRALCAERFAEGPEWDAAFFQLGGYPDWACPMYELDGVYFSTGKGWQ